jgi:hypothetical protein
MGAIERPAIPDALEHGCPPVRESTLGYFRALQPAALAASLLKFNVILREISSTRDPSKI